MRCERVLLARAVLVARLVRHGTVLRVADVDGLATLRERPRSGEQSVGVGVSDGPSPTCSEQHDGPHETRVGHRLLV